MLFLFAMIMALVLVLLCRKSIKKSPNLYYVVAFLVVMLTFTLDFSGTSVWVKDWLAAVFQRGAFATALWGIVMWTGALPNGSKRMKTFMPIRGELSILATIFTVGHNLTFGRTYFVRMFTAADKMPGTQFVAGMFSIIMLLIIIPLAIMSVPQIRKKMKAAQWKKYQRFAYLFYALLYAHVMVLMVPMARKGREDYAINVIVYSVIFIGYAVCRIRKWYMLKRKPENKVTCNIIGTVGYLAMLVAVIFLTKGRTVADNSMVVIEETMPTTESATMELESEQEAPETIAEIETEMVVETTAEEIVESTEATIVEEATEQKTSASIVTEPVRVYKDGDYTASAPGYDGMVEITLIIRDDRITSVKGTHTESDSWYYETASDVLFSQIVTTQSLELDAVSGATYSSEGILNAAKKALEQARN